MANKDRTPSETMMEATIGSDPYNRDVINAALEAWYEAPYPDYAKWGEKRMELALKADDAKRREQEKE